MAGSLYRTVHHHCGWDNSLEPALTIAPGDAVELEILEASGGRITRQSSAADVLKLNPDFANPLTGPIRVQGAEPGDTLVVEMLDYTLSGWGWTALIPGFGLLADAFPEPFLHLTEHNAQRIAFTPEIAIPTRPFTGTIGVAPAEPGRHSAIPPRRVGGNLDCPDIVRGARLHLPVKVAGALLSVGDTHAAQGDGEVCGTAVESPMRVRLRVHVRKGMNLPAPQIELPGQAVRSPDPKGYWITTGIGPDLMDAARDAVQALIDHLLAEYHLTPELAYCLCSVAADLRISEAVNAPNWVVAAYLPKGIFL